MQISWIQPLSRQKSGCQFESPGGVHILLLTLLAGAEAHSPSFTEPPRARLPLLARHGPVNTVRAAARKVVTTVIVDPIVKL
ncbi:hypothetical protein Pla144_18780 [Bythopirellula polymerisocia]|uniref:Uncharacterized protein n=2 Tax=Bythopirellula polymerisocia TaxID=2528003 RepID=A0A5C6CYH2_9BACT|nr:hypothetical protein Pla144_18780 [Bythopirellula polymerisocia]